MKTFDQARREILDYLKAIGWDVAPTLKVPHATSRDGRLRLWFKPQAVHHTVYDGPFDRGVHTLGNARAISYDIDIRRMTAAEFVERLRGWFPDVSIGATVPPGRFQP